MSNFFLWSTREKAEELFRISMTKIKFPPVIVNQKKLEVNINLILKDGSTTAEIVMQTELL